MARTNYTYEKRQRELEKARKKQEKAQRKHAAQPTAPPAAPPVKKDAAPQESPSALEEHPGEHRGVEQDPADARDPDGLVLLAQAVDEPEARRERVGAP